MFAQVYPILRLPRRFGYFDYEIPKGMEVHVGDLVEVPFRGRTTFALVRTLTQTAEVKKTVQIKKVLTPLCVREADIDRWETIARATIQSPSSIISASFQGLSAKKAYAWERSFHTPDLRFEKDLTQHLQENIEHIFDSPSSFLQTSWEGSVLIAHLLRRKTSGQILILTPTEREAEILFAQTAFQKSAVLHGKIKQNHRKSIIQAWCSGEITTLITTRQGVLLPAHALRIIFILDAGADDYLVKDRNPRIDVRLCADLLATQHQAHLILAGSVPRTDEVAHRTPITWDLSLNFRLVDLTRKEEYTGSPLLSESLKIATTEALQNRKKALWFANRKGGAKRLQCRDCGYIPRCGTCHSFPLVRTDDLQCPLCLTEMWLPKECPSCHSKRLKTAGIGIERIAKEAQRLFPTARVAVYDKDRPLDAEADILLVTEAYFARHHRPFLPRTFGLMADVCLEHHFLAVNDRSPESALRKVFRLAYTARQQHAECLIQTVDILRAQKMQHPALFLDEEYATRQRYALAPSTWTWRMVNDVHTAPTPHQARLLSPSLQALPDSAIIQPELPSYGPFCSQPPQ